MADHNNRGKWGEDIAASYLLKKGYLILERGWRIYHWELDIVATINNLLVIVEVKTRSTHEHADPDDTISNKKLRKIFDATEKYMELKRVEWEVRYDLVTVIDHGDTWTIEHLEDAFYPFMQ